MTSNGTETYGKPCSISFLTKRTFNDWNECSRLLTNAILYYNTALLSKVYAQKVAAGDQEAIELLRGVSPCAWQHVNLLGAIEFMQRASKVDLEALAARYTDPAFWSKVLQATNEDMLD